MKETAKDKITIEIDYPRPFYEFPDLHSEQGNPLFYWKDAISAIRKNGFKKEAEDIINYYSRTINIGFLPEMDYDAQFNFLAKFLDFTNGEKISEDEDYITYRVKKTDGLAAQETKQPLLFNLKNIETLTDLIEQNTDFSITNCYSRNIFHYLDNVSTLDFLLTENKKHQWINLFSIDNFHGTILHTHNNLKTFTLLLTTMYKENPELTQKYFTAIDDFDMNASGIYLRLLDTLFCQKKSVDSIDPSLWTDLCDSLSIIKSVNLSMHNDIVNNIKNIPSLKTALNDKSNTSAHKLYNYIIFDSTIIKKEDNNIKTIVKSKL